MPEGDTIFRAARTLHRVFAGKTVTRFESMFPGINRIAEDRPVVGRTIDAVASRGKHLVGDFVRDRVVAQPEVVGSGLHGSGSDTPAVVEEEGSWKLCGVIALRSLILADTDAPLSEVMRDEFQFAHPKDSAREVAETIAEYNLLALPVIDDAGEIAGIVTVDDAMERLLPKDWRQRLPRVFG